MALVAEQYIGRICAIFADDARERGVMGASRVPSLQTPSGIEEDEDQDQDVDGDEVL